MEKTIPTVELEIGEEKKKVKVYQWMTLEESSRYSEIALGDIDITEVDKVAQTPLTPKVWGEMNKYLIACLCVDPGFDVINQWRQSDRDELLDKLRDLLEKNELPQQSL